MRHEAEVSLGEGGTRKMDVEWFGKLLQTEVSDILDRIGPAGFHRGHYASALRLLHEAVTAREMPDFITVPAYDVLNAFD